MILVDWSQVTISNLMAHTKTQSDINEDMLRHMILNSLRNFRSMYNSKYGELVIAIDSRHYWRRDVFPYYKALRKKAREDSKYDWPVIFEILDKIKKEIKETFPYRMIEVDGAEADDIIGVIAKYKHAEEPVMIISADKDFIQLHQYKGVRQYSPMQKKMVSHPKPKAYKTEHIIRGDRGDGIPNFLSDDRDIIDCIRQRPISKKKLAIWLTQKPEEICETAEMGDRWERNSLLVDLDRVPEDIVQSILSEYDEPINGKRSKIMKYFMKNRMRILADSIGDF